MQDFISCWLEKKREEVSIFLFCEEKEIGTFGKIIYPLLIIYQIKIPLKGKITHSTEARVKLTVTNFLDDFFLSYKIVDGIQSDPSTDNYAIPDIELIHDSLMLQILWYLSRHCNSCRC